MLITQHPYIDENNIPHLNLIRHYSDENFMIRQVETGCEYQDAIDVYPCGFTYEETDIPIVVEDDEASDDEENVENPE